jgi:hypothetical protein
MRVAIAVTLLVSLASINHVSAAALASECAVGAVSDVDGGGPDAILGLPSYDLPGMPDAGALLIFSNVLEEGKPEPSPPTAVTLVTADDIAGLGSQAGARFGASVVVWRDMPFDDDDHCADLLVGAPGQNVDGIAGAGEAYLIRGTTSGPDDARVTFNEAGLPGTGGGQPRAGFGSSLAADTLQTIAIGAPGRDAGTAVDAGRVVRLDYANAPDPTVTIIEQGGTGADSPEAGDQFGEVVELMPSAAGPVLLVGVPHEDVAAKVDAGAVALVPRGGELSMVNQDSADAGELAESGDLYGAALDGYTSSADRRAGLVAIGAPGEDFRKGADSGGVFYASVNLSTAPGRNSSPIKGMANTLTQDSPGVLDTVEPGDRFGAAVLLTDFGRGNGALDLVVGAPLEDVGRMVDAGAVSRTPIRPDGSLDSLRRAAAWRPGTSGEPGRAQPGDQLGASLSVVELRRLNGQGHESLATIITMPGKDVGTVVDAGLAYLSGSAGGFPVPLVATNRQAGAGNGLTPMKIG